jgi:hypothetical protein
MAHSSKRIRFQLNIRLTDEASAMLKRLVAYESRSNGRISTSAVMERLIREEYEVKQPYLPLV